MKKSLLALLPFLSACAGEPPQDIGVRDGRLIACPESPNCVSSYESSEEHAIAALDGNLNQSSADTRRYGWSQYRRTVEQLPLRRVH